MRKILVATDFSAGADRAIPSAYAALPHGGTVVLLHVVQLLEPGVPPNPLYAHYVPGRAPSAEERAREAAEARARLRASVPAEAERDGIATEIEVVEALDVAGAITESADRNGVDAVCLATHGRTGVAKLLFGSVAQEVLRRSRRPLLLVPPPRR